MKTIAVLFLGFMLTGCGPTPTLEQLEDQAFLTGDWTAVEKHERRAQRRQAQLAQVCSPDFVSYCMNGTRNSHCSCVSRQRLADLLEF
jgi:hypothetical protein